MALSREVVVPGMLAEYQRFMDLTRDLSDEDWEHPTRCEMWKIADVAAHVVGQLTDVVSFQLEGLGTPEVTGRQVQGRQGRRPNELADELLDGTKTAAELAESFDDAAWNGPAPGGTTGTLGFGIEALWFDTFLHADDIRDALGEPTKKGDGLLASVSHIAQVLSDRGWGPATLSLGGIPDFAVSGGNGRIVVDEPMKFVLVATGRGDPRILGLDETVNIYR